MLGATTLSEGRTLGPLPPPPPPALSKFLQHHNRCCRTTQNLSSTTSNSGNCSNICSTDSNHLIWPRLSFPLPPHPYPLPPPPPFLPPPPPLPPTAPASSLEAATKDTSLHPDSAAHLSRRIHSTGKRTCGGSKGGHPTSSKGSSCKSTTAALKVRTSSKGDSKLQLAIWNAFALLFPPSSFFLNFFFITFIMGTKCLSKVREGPKVGKLYRRVAESSA